MNDELFIKKTLALAARARGQTSPNPMVGALIVKGGRIVSEGYHKKAGAPHAEVMAIEKAGAETVGSTLYTSLEPCCHQDKRTPPCTDRIVNSGITRIVISMEDPNPKVLGRGIETLRNAGIEVFVGILENKALRLNEVYIKNIRTGLPFVVLKVAMTLDGKIATPEGKSQWITGENSRRLVHRLRGSSDAVMTAIGTIRADDPELTCRMARGRNPARIIIDPEMEIKPDAKVISSPPPTLLVARTTAVHNPKIEDQMKKYILEERGVKLIEHEEDKVDLNWLMHELGRKHITSILIEAGGSFNASCLEAEIVDKVMIFIAPKIIGGRDSVPAVGGKTFRELEDAYQLEDVSIKRISEDILIEGYIKK
jgi:diaminohydroxyphosphoribosylaminopyrimidine deaminase/5-amino-6-(5-phosphoribosylamino)uracil reductase